MKKVVLLIIMFIQIHLAYSQTYYPLPDSNVIWKMNWGSSGCIWSNLFDNYQYQISGDTLINTLTYHKVDRSGDFDCHAAPLYPEIGYMGAFRNDIENKLVYFVARDSLNEMLLYDFNLEVGDTIKGYLVESSPWGEANISIIYNIDSILVGNDYRKRWHYAPNEIDPFMDGYIIEGIGSENDLLGGLQAIHDMNGLLNCFSVDNQTLYPNNSAGPCDLVTSDNTIDYKKKVVIYCSPNPASNSIQFITDEEVGIYSYKIYDGLGREVRNSVFIPNQTIDISNIKSGIYFVLFLNEDADLLTTSKFIKSQD